MEYLTDEPDRDFRAFGYDSLDSDGSNEENQIVDAISVHDTV